MENKTRNLSRHSSDKTQRSASRDVRRASEEDINYRIQSIVELRQLLVCLPTIVSITTPLCTRNTGISYRFCHVIYLKHQYIYELKTFCRLFSGYPISRIRFSLTKHVTLVLLNRSPKNGRPTAVKSKQRREYS